jgi:hypothetical protein
MAVPSGGAALACSLCPGLAGNRTTVREDAGLAKLVLFGTLANARITADGSGATDLKIETILKKDAILGDRKVLTLPRYVPVDAKNPPKFLVFCDVINGQIDAYRGSPAKSAAVVDYLRGAQSLPADRTKQLQYFFDFLDHADADVALDAYMEFAKTPDLEVAKAAKRLDAAKLRKLLSDPATPAERLGLFAYLLGASGTSGDSAFLLGLLNNPDERFRSAFSGILAGLIQLDPKSGWEQTRSILADPKRPFGQRLAALGALRFFHASQPEATKPDVLKGLAVIMPQKDLGDLAIEDLRRWQWWDLTKDVLDHFDKPSHSAPLMQRAIVRYALCCPKPEAKQFVDRVRAKDPEMVKDVEEGLSFEQPISSKK